MSSPPLRLEDPNNIFWPYINSYREHFEAGCYKIQQIRRYMACVLHFGNWVRSLDLTLFCIGETEVDRFLHEHLPQCSCARSVPTDLVINRAALNHLIRHLRHVGEIAEVAPDEITCELAAFDRRMADVWGMARGTRAHRCMIIRRLLKAEFANGPVDISAMSTTGVHAFVLGKNNLSPTTVRVMAGAVRCYLRHRTLLGDNVRHLCQAVPTPVKWTNNILPEGLTDDELEQLLHAFDMPCPSRRRGYAIVRCLVDLGLRTSEVIGLRLDDIDWEAGTVRLEISKSRRASLLPLPAATGQAIVDYILHERPKTDRREIFVRHVGPHGELVGRRVVQKTLHAAYKRLGWNRTRVHILRHTLGSRLINSGTPIKQIADVLRHRSIRTAAGYMRVDTTRLSAVALPWPGELP